MLLIRKKSRLNVLAYIKGKLQLSCQDVMFIMRRHESMRLNVVSIPTKKSHIDKTPIFFVSIRSIRFSQNGGANGPHPSPIFLH